MKAKTGAKQKNHKGDKRRRPYWAEKENPLDPTDLVSPRILVQHQCRRRVRAIAALADVSAEEAYGEIIFLCLSKYSDEALSQIVKALNRHDPVALQALQKQNP